MRQRGGEIHRSLEGCDNWIFMTVMKAYQVFSETVSKPQGDSSGSRQRCLLSPLFTLSLLSNTVAHKFLTKYSHIGKDIFKALFRPSKVST